MAAGDDAHPPPRVRGMLGPETPDEFSEFDRHTPPVCRSAIADFTVDDALSVLDGDVTPAESRQIAQAVRDAIRDGRRLPKRPHGGHRSGTGWGKGEFAPGFDEDDCVDVTRALVDHPGAINPDATMPGFFIHGMYRGTRAVVVIRPVSSTDWQIVAVYPERGEA